MQFFPTVYTTTVWDCIGLGPTTIFITLHGQPEIYIPNYVM